MSLTFSIQLTGAVKHHLASEVTAADFSDSGDEHLGIPFREVDGWRNDDLSVKVRYWIGPDASDDTKAELDSVLERIELPRALDYESDRDISHITYVIERTADDTAEFGTMVTGKGAIACGEGKIEMLSMGMAKDIMDGVGPYCPAPEEPVSEAAVVCARS